MAPLSNFLDRLTQNWAPMQGQGPVRQRSSARVDIDEAVDGRDARPRRGGEEGEELYKILDEYGDGPATAQQIYDDYLRVSENGRYHLINIDVPDDSQQAIGQHLAQVVMADGALSSNESEALSDIADQHYGKNQELPWLNPHEADVLKQLVLAPNDEIRNHMVGLIGKDGLSLEDMERVVEMTAGLDPRPEQFLRSLDQRHVLGMALDARARGFLGHLNHTGFYSQPPSYEQYLGAAKAINLNRKAKGMPLLDVSPAAYEMIRWTSRSGK